MIIVCRMCRSKNEVSVTPSAVDKWQAGALIQDVMPELTPDERELLISQTCGTCFDKLFPPDPED